jgi:hypothetical protein
MRFAVGDLGLLHLKQRVWTLLTSKTQIRTSLVSDLRNQARLNQKFQVAGSAGGNTSCSFLLRRDTLLDGRIFWPKRALALPSTPIGKLIIPICSRFLPCLRPLRPSRRILPDLPIKRQSTRPKCLLRQAEYAIDADDLTTMRRTSLQVSRPPHGAYDGLVRHRQLGWMGILPLRLRSDFEVALPSRYFPRNCLVRNQFHGQASRACECK